MGPDGTWRSAMGATMTLHVARNGVLTGTYRSPAGHAAGLYPVVGRVDPTPGTDHGAAVGWTVVWVNPEGNAHSATTWCGRWSPEGTLHTTWLLTGTAGADWEATRVGHDDFVLVDSSHDAGRDPAEPRGSEVETVRAGST